MAGKRKTIAVRLDPTLHSKLVIIANLEGRSLTDLIVGAMESYVEESRTALNGARDTLLQRAEAEAEAKRQVILGLFEEA